MPCHVRRPNNNASAVVMLAPMTGPITSGSKYGPDQPPCAKPPSVSSSAPPGACTTPSRLMNSYTTTRIARSFLHVLARTARSDSRRLVRLLGIDGRPRSVPQTGRSILLVQREQRGQRLRLRVHAFPGVA